MRHIFSLLLFVFVANTLFAQAISPKKLKKHVAYLAADKMRGRGTGTPEERKAAEYIAKQFKKVGLKPMGDEGSFFHHFDFQKTKDPHGGVEENAPRIKSQNVAAFLDNGAEYTIIIGAHYDHLGLGYDRNSLDANPEGKIHNGADDNASGTAGVIELARYYAKNEEKEQHNFLFLCFSGEELGLFGSKKYVDRPTIDLGKVSFMLNMDMIGRLNAEKRLMVGGVGTAPDFVPLLNAIKGDLTMRLDSAGTGPSDHTSFYQKNLPVLFFFTGQHSDYHKPGDDIGKINFEGESQVLDLAIRTIAALDQKPKLSFQETKSNQTQGVSFKVTLGIMPDYTYEGTGVRVDGVTDGKPASKAGIQKGDIITGMGDVPISTIQDYMKCLSTYKKGDGTTVKVKRGTEDKVLNATF